MNPSPALSAAALDARSRRLSAASASTLRGIRGVMMDIDGTLTRDGEIEPEALAALHVLHDAGLSVIAFAHTGFTHLPAQGIAAGVALMREEGIAATVSSIHIIGWFGEHSKRTGAQWMLRRCFGRALQEVRGQGFAERVRAPLAAWAG